MPQRPAIVLVHGFWGGAAHWAKVIGQLHKRGYHDLNAVENPLISLADDVARTQQMVRQMRGPVLLVGHSYGGAVITEAGNCPMSLVRSVSRPLRRMQAKAPAACRPPQAA